MLTLHDDYPLHQTTDPIAHPSTTDLNYYDRYFFNGFSRDGDLFFAVAMGLYPNRRVLDASLSVVRDGRLVSLHASRLAPAERSETRVGPLSIEVVEPMRLLRVRCAANQSGLECDLLFRARTSAIEEPRMTLAHEGRLLMNTTRFTQFGSWEGSLRVDGTAVDVAAERVLGVRDRSWGIRPVGERSAGAPGPPPQFFWLWAPLHFDDRCTLLGVCEDGEGRVTHAGGAVAPVYGSPEQVPATAASGIERMASVAHRIRWQPGTRRSASAEIELVPHGAAALSISLEPLLCFPMVGIGYTHPEWGHGLWKGEEAVAAESWKLDELDPLDPRHIHVQQLCRARAGDREGVGVLEQLVIGPHGPYGFRSLLDGAA